jgi:uncharacterized membrane protein
MRSDKILLRISLGLTAFSIFGTFMQAALKVDPGWVAPVCSALMLASGAGAVAARARVKESRRTWLGAAAVLALGAASEIIGLATGLPFGRYEYTGAWPPSLPLGGLGSWPMMLPVAWLWVVGASWCAAPGQGWRRAAAAGLIAAAFDTVFLEPVMAGPLGYWSWTEPGPLPGGAPWLNVFGWVLTSTAAAAILNRCWGEWRDRRLALWLLGGLGLFCAAILAWALLFPAPQ